MISNTFFNSLITPAYQTAKHNGFYEDIPEAHLVISNLDNQFRIIAECAYVCSELFEALDAYAKRRLNYSLTVYTTFIDLENWKDLFERDFKDTFIDELSDTVIRLASLWGLLGFNRIGVFPWVRYPEPIEGTDALAFEIYGICALIYRFTNNLNSVVTIVPFYTCIVSAVLHLAFGYYTDEQLKNHIRLKMEYNKHRGHLHGKM